MNLFINLCAVLLVLSLFCVISTTEDLSSVESAIKPKVTDTKSSIEVDKEKPNGDHVETSQPKNKDDNGIDKAKNQTISPPTPVENHSDEVSSNDPLQNLNNPGALHRAVLVFGFLGLAAIIYLYIYRRRHKSITNHPTTHSETGPFKYGVLKNENNTDRMEMSHLPLTMDSDDDDDDLEIFDLQQKKSLSYTNLKKDEPEWGKSDKEVINGDSPSENKNVLLYLDDDDDEEAEYVRANFVSSSHTKLV